MAGKVVASIRTKSDHRVEFSADKPRTPDTVAFMDVADLIAFAAELEGAEAPLHDQVRVTLTRPDGYLIRSMAVYWSTDETDGRPTPQAMPQ